MFTKKIKTERRFSHIHCSSYPLHIVGHKLQEIVMNYVQTFKMKLDYISFDDIKIDVSTPETG